jgi:acetyl-CoA carboxylase carboxyl transferase subunit beta
MNWLSNLLPPRIRSFVSEQKEMPDNLWQKCSSCEGMLFHRDLAENWNVCYHCGHHMRLTVAERLKMMFDGGEYEKLDLPKVEQDPLKFKDRKRYADRIKEAQAQTGFKDAITVARGKMDGLSVVVAAFHFSYMGGSMGAYVGEGIVKAAETAIKDKAALIVIPASGGARMQEGMLSLMQMPRTIIAVEMVKDERLPYIVLLTDPTTGGVSASFAMVGDIHIAEPGAMIGFAGRRVIEETVRERLPENFQTAEYLLEHGMVDMVVPRKDMKKRLSTLIGLLMKKEPKTFDPSGGTKSNKPAMGGKDGAAPSSAAQVKKPVAGYIASTRASSVKSAKQALSQVKAAQKAVRNISENAKDITGQNKKRRSA